MNKKAQMQMGESIAIIIIILILIIGSLVFYGKLKASSINNKKDLNYELDVVKLSQVVYGLAEIQCSFAEVSDYGCIDALKFKYLSKMIHDSKDNHVYFYYRELFGTSKIYLDIVNNTGGIKYEELYYNKRNSTGNSSIFMPVIVYNPLTTKNSFGILTVVKYD